MNNANIIYKMKRPSLWWSDNWREGAPIGNGFTGALVYGNISNERIMLTSTYLWREGKVSELPDVSDILPKMRELIFSGKVKKADTLLNKALIDRGYAPHEAYPFPAADICIRLPIKNSFSNYERGVYLDKAEAYVKYSCNGENFERRSFVSRADDAVVTLCPKDSEIDISLHTPDYLGKGKIKIPENSLTERSDDGQWLFFKAEIGKKEHGVVVRVIRGEKTLVIAKLFTEGTHKTEWKRLKEEIEKLPCDYDTLLSRHIPLHKELFDRCRFELDCREDRERSNEELLDMAYESELPAALAERMYAFGKYLFICSTAVGSNPVNLTGLWSGEYRAFWAFNMANINIEMTYWHVLSGNLKELCMPLFDYYDAAIDEMKENAQKIYGCDGIFLPAVSMPGGLKHVCLKQHITNWTGGAGWIAQHYYDYYLFTRDNDFLKNRALPFMREAAKFYCDFVIWKGETWHVCPSVSPENHTENYKNAGIKLPSTCQSSIDATMDIAIIKELFINLCDIAEKTELIGEKELSDYKRMLGGAPEYLVNENGAPREWLHPDFPDNPYHRHQSHLYPMFPGLELAHKDEKTDEIYRNGGIERMTLGIGSQTSWSLVQNANLMARVGDAELAFESLNRVVKGCVMRNLFTTHNDWADNGLTLNMPLAPFQIDANIGFPAAIQEMLMFSDDKRLYLLPALPKQWKKGRIGRMLARCGVYADITWENGLLKAELEAFRDTTFELYTPDKNIRTISMKSGDKITAEAKLLR